MTEIPQELVDMVIDHLHGDRRALSACSLVCRSWLPSSRFHKFASITKYCGAATDGADIMPFSECPVAAQYVRDLTLQLAATMDGNLRLNCCTGLQDLTLWGWGLLPVHLLTSISSPYLSTTVKSLKLAGCQITSPSDVALLIHSLPLLQSLWTEGVRIKDPEPHVAEARPVTLAPPLSGQLHIDVSRWRPNHSFSLTRTLSSLPHGISFKSIHIDSGPARVLWPNPLNCIVQACGQSLHRFTSGCNILKQGD
jgi:hypothetical protein